MSWQTDTEAALEALAAQRLAIIQAGPKPSYNLHGHQVDWTAYLRYIDESMRSLREQLAQGQPFEFVSRGL